jgi:hypothetical protein
VSYAEPETCRNHGHAGGASNTATGRPPVLKVSTTCEAAAQSAGMLGRDKQACLDEEHTAMELLAKNWSEYKAEQKILCTGMVRQGGPPSYVELVACLDIMKDAAAIRQKGLDPTVASPAAKSIP